MKPTHFVIFICINLKLSYSLEEFMKWQQVEFENLPEDVEFLQYNNVPQGFAVHKDKVFLAIPRRNKGIPSTLNYVKLEANKDTYVNPKLHSYPNYETNELNTSHQADPNRIVSVYRPRVDECERLWFVDSGITNTSGTAKIIQRPSIWVIDLKDDKLVSRYEIPENVVRDGLGLASITVDVDDCDENKAYRIEHNYFRMNPFEGDFNVDGLKFSWDDGIFSVTLSNKDIDGYRTAYFHPMCSFSEFAISTKILRNETLATRSYHGKDVKLVGSRGKDTQSTMHSYHANSGIIYYAQINKNAISCWNSNRELNPSNFKEIVRDDIKLVYPSDLMVVNDDLWVMSNRMIRHIYTKLDPDDSNFRLFRISIKDATCKPSNPHRRKFRN